MYDFRLLCKDDERYTNVLGTGPLEFFWDIVDQKLQGKVEGLVRRYNEEHQRQVPSDKGYLSQTSRLPTPNSNVSIASLTSPFTRGPWGQ